MFFPVLALCLLMCSCKGPAADVTDTVITTEKETEPVETADVSLLLNAAGFSSVYSEKLDARFVTKEGISSGFFARIIVYSPDSISVRLVCTDADEFEYEGVKYEVRDSDVPVDGRLLSVLRKIAHGGECRIGQRNITDEERRALFDTVTLYDAAFGAPYIIDTEDIKEQNGVTEDKDGNLVFDSGRYTVTYPPSFSAEYKEGVFTVTSGVNRQRCVSISYTDTAFSPGIADGDSVDKLVAEAGGTLVSGVTDAVLSGNAAYRFKYEISGVYLTQYFVDAGSGTYILTAATYDRSDRIPENIISTFTIK